MSRGQSDEEGQRPMKRIGVGLVGAGFIGPHHVDAVRRLGYVDVVAVAGSNEASAKKKAAEMHIPKAYGSYEALLDDPAVEVIHNCTPNALHYPVNAAAIAKGKHVVSDKPLAMTAAEAKSLARPGDQGRHRPRRHLQLSRQPADPAGAPRHRARRHRHAALRPRPVPAGLAAQGHRLLVAPRAEKSGASSALGDIGSHWCDLAQHVSGLRIVEVLADITTVIKKRKKPVGSREAFAAAGADDKVELVDIKVEDLASVLIRFDNGAKGSFSVGQVCAGHKNDLRLEVCGSKARYAWKQEVQNELWVGNRDKANESCRRIRG
jgi:predicted dehydrogenase